MDVRHTTGHERNKISERPDQHDLRYSHPLACTLLAPCFNEYALKRGPVSLEHLGSGPGGETFSEWNAGVWGFKIGHTMFAIPLCDYTVCVGLSGPKIGRTILSRG